MKERVKQKVIEFGMPKFIAGMFSRNIPKLERWNITVINHISIVMLIESPVKKVNCFIEKEEK